MNPLDQPTKDDVAQAKAFSERMQADAERLERMEARPTSRNQRRLIKKQKRKLAEVVKKEIAKNLDKLPDPQIITGQFQAGPDNID